MQPFRLLLSDVLRDTDRLKSVVLGGGPKKPWTQEQRDVLLVRLTAVAKSSRTWVYLTTGMLIIVFGLVLCFALFYEQSPLLISLGLGGTFLSVLGIIRILQGVWRDKVAIDILLAVLPELGPGDCLQIIESYYYTRWKSQT